MYPTRGRGPRFPQAYMPNRSCQEDGWDRPKQNWYPDGPGRGQFYNSRANGDNFGQYRGSYRGRGWRRPRSDFPEERHYRGHSYRRSKTSFTKGRYQHASRPPCLKTISLKNSQTAEVSSSHTSPVPPAKTPTEQTSSIKKDPHNMGKEPVSMRERHSAAAESSANQTHPVPFPEAPLHAPEYTEELHAKAKEKYVLCEVRQSRDRLGDVISPVAVEIPFLFENTDDHQSEGKEAIERTIQMKWRYSEAAKSSANQTLPIPPPEAPVEEQTTLETTERRPTAKQNSILNQPTVQTDEKYIQHVVSKEGAQSYVLDGHTVEPPQSLQMKERDRDSESAESSANQTQPILSSEAPVEEQTTPETTEHHSTVKQNSILKQPTVLRDETCIQHAPPEEGEGATNQAPNDNSVKTPSTGSHKEASPGQKDLGLTGFPLNFSSIHYVPVLVQKAEMQLLSSHSLPQTHVICDRKCDIERLLVCHSCSSRIHHSSASEYSSQNCVPREFCILRSRSPHRQEQELRSDHKKKQKLGSFCRQEQSLKSSRKCKPSPHRRKQHSGSPQRRSDYVGSCYHCYCDYKYDCSLSQENPKESDLSPRYLPHKINNCHSPKERSEKVSHLNSPASHTVKAKKEKVMQPEEMAKKKRSSSGKGTKFIKIQKTVSNYEDTTSPQHPNTEEKTSSSAISWTLKDRSADVLAKEEIEEIQTTASNYEVQGSPQHPNTEEKTSSSDISWTLKDRSAAVLAKKEEIEEAYLRVLLNFAVMAIMLVEKEPSMETTIGSALRANLRRTGDYYEHMLKNYIDSLAEPS
ncbi:uncharacterized protein [Anolis sagrei]|uniref:uncharacterized protein isoform X8 n=1 Tax=Anolis sagrei TaxID=38937 RepID=UPI00351FC0E8